MKYALVNNIRTEATSRAIGFCPVCNSNMRGYAGQHRMKHWKHISIKNCDSWFEPETEWHRGWKNKFPPEWQETIIERDSLKHIADVHNPNKDLVIEFQNSLISVDILSQREIFYDRMIWMVNTIPYLKSIALEKAWHNFFSERIIKPAERKYNSINNSFWKVVGRIIKIYTLKLDGANIVARMQLESFVSVFDADLREKLFNSIWDLMNSILSYEEMRIKTSELVRNLLFKNSEYHESERIINEIHQLEYSLLNKYKAYKFSKLEPDKDLFFFDWKHQHKHWNYAKKPVFIDIGGLDIYLVTDNWEYGSGFIVRRYSKNDFLSHYLQ